MKIAGTIAGFAVGTKIGALRTDALRRGRISTVQDRRTLPSCGAGLHSPKTWP